MIAFLHLIIHSLSLYLSIHLSIDLSIHLFIYIYALMYVCIYMADNHWPGSNEKILRLLYKVLNIFSLPTPYFCLSLSSLFSLPISHLSLSPFLYVSLSVCRSVSVFLSFCLSLPLSLSLYSRERKKNHISIFITNMTRYIIDWVIARECFFKGRGNA